MTYGALMKQTLEMLTCLTRDNRQVQEYLFTHLHTLLGVKYAVLELADMLREVLKSIFMLTG